MIDRPIPVDSLLVPGTIEELENRAMILDYGVAALERGKLEPKLTAADGAKIVSERSPKDPGRNSESSATSRRRSRMRMRG